MNPWVRIGVVGKPHGLKGAFFIHGRAEPLPLTIKTLRIGKTPESAQSTKLLSRSTGSGNSEVLRCEAAGDRTAAEKLQGNFLWAHRDEIGLAEEVDCLRSDIIGKAVLDLTGKELGVIEDVYDCGASDIVTIRQGHRSADIPLVPTYFDMDFSAAATHLQLQVNGEVFDELWEDERPR
jgi:16S rRNA processing protein RimM